jgi:NADH:ubiquinone oxidoreductase subunit 6 (subunit J)
VSPLTILFALCCAGAALGAVGVVGFSNVLYAAFSLFLSLGTIAVLFGLLGADFIMAVQLIVYVGGILVLILFGVLLTTRIYEVKLRDQVFHPAVGIIAGLLLFALLAAVIWVTPWPSGGELALQPTSHAIGDLLLSHYLLPFEVVSLLLLAAIVGAAVMVRREVREEEGEE